MSSFDPNNPFSYSSFDPFNHRSAFDRHDHFTSHAQHHHEMKASADHFHNHSHQTSRDEQHARATREYSAQITRSLDFVSITERLRKFFCRD